MLVPSIDLQNGNAVQLIGGKEKAIDAGDPRPIAKRFRLAGDIAVIDLDAAMGSGSNEKVICDLIQMAPCRVGGGIRDVETARKWLDRGAKSVILGTKAVPEILKELPKERVIAALDAVYDEVVVEGWKTKTGQSILEKMAEIKDYVGGFLITFVEHEGRLKGTDLKRAAKLIEAAAPAHVTIAGGVTTIDDISTLDELGADAQVGMALYSGRLDLGDAISAPIFKRLGDSLWPTVVVNERNEALGLVWSSQESFRKAVEMQRGVYYSRSRKSIWIKGETSGATQELISIGIDCDRDALKFVVKQSNPGFCHLQTDTCWGNLSGLTLLEKTLQERLTSAPEGSYTKRLFNDSDLLQSKIKEEAKELAEARTKEEIIAESADVLYFTLCNMAKENITLSDVENQLNLRARKLTRRGGDKKD